MGYAGFITDLKRCASIETRRFFTIAKRAVLISLLFLFSASPIHALHKGVYPVKQPHEGTDIKPVDAYRLIKENKNVFIVDVRTRYEYQDIGHPEGAYNIPVFFYTTETGEKGYKMEPNENFCRDLQDRFKSRKVSLLMICRSGYRSTTAAQKAIDCGFNKENVYNVLGGFEGDKIHEGESPFYGKRMVGGWRLEGLPWTYQMLPGLMYRPDIDVNRAR